jgi:MFS family permease
MSAEQHGEQTGTPYNKYCWVVLFVGTLAVLGALGLGRFGYTPILPAMQAGLGMDNTQAGIMASINLIGYLTLSVIGGALSSRFGPRRVVVVGLLFVATGMVMTGLSNTFLSAAAWRCVTGFGSGAANVAVMGMWGAWFPTSRRGLASGIAVTGSSLGLITVGPLVPQLLATYGAGGWRICWYYYAATTFIIAVLSYFFIRQPPRVNPVDRAAPTPAKTGLAWGLVYRSAPVWRLGIVYMANGFSYIIFMTFFIKRLVGEGGYSRMEAGALFMTMGWASLFCGVAWGFVSDIIGRRRALITVYLIHTVAFALFALWPTTTGFTISAVLFGFTAWSIPAIMAATCGDILGSRLAPAALGFITLFFGIGQAVAPSLAGAMADATGTFTSAYILAAAVALVGAIGSTLLKPASTEVAPQ